MSWDFLSRLRETAADIQRMIGHDMYDCCICGRDVRIAGGSSSEASAICNRCVPRISAVDQCDFCGWGTSTMQIRVVDTAHHVEEFFEGDDFPGLGEKYRTCHECFRKLNHPNREFYQHILNVKCAFCRKRFGLCVVRFMNGNEIYDNRRCCTKCLPQVRETAEQIRRRYSEQESPPESNIEIKDNICYVWNPRELELKRDHTLQSRTMMDVRVDIGGAATRPDLSNAMGCRRAFIYDGDTIWILKKCMLDSHVDMRGRDASFYTISYYLHFVVFEFETRNAATEQARHDNDPSVHIERVTGGGRDAYHNQIYTDALDVFNSIGYIATGSDWAAQLPSNNDRVELNDSGLNADRTFALPQTFTAVWNSPIETEPLGAAVIEQTRRELGFVQQWTLDYNRARGNNVNTPVNDVAVWCSCGFRGETTHTNNDFRHSHMHINVDNGLSGPGSNFAMNVGGHTIHFQQAHAQSGS